MLRNKRDHCIDNSMRRAALTQFERADTQDVVDRQRWVLFQVFLQQTVRTFEAPQRIGRQTLGPGPVFGAQLVEGSAGQGLGHQTGVFAQDLIQ